MHSATSIALNGMRATLTRTGRKLLWPLGLSTCLLGWSGLQLSHKTFFFLFHWLISKQFQNFPELTRHGLKNGSCEIFTKNFALSQAIKTQPVLLRKTPVPKIFLSIHNICWLLALDRSGGRFVVVQFQISTSSGCRTTSNFVKASLVGIYLAIIRILCKL